MALGAASGPTPSMQAGRGLGHAPGALAGAMPVAANGLGEILRRELMQGFTVQRQTPGLDFHDLELSGLGPLSVVRVKEPLSAIRTYA